MRCISNTRLKSYGSRNDSDDKHSPGADARKRVGGVNAGVGPCNEGSWATGCEAGSANGSGLFESVRLDRRWIGRTGSALNTTMPFQHENTGTGESVCIAS
jgi:hypothetical protein